MPTHDIPYRTCETCGKVLVRQQKLYCSQPCFAQGRVRSIEQDVHVFWQRVDRSGGTDACWPWQGARKPDGYGQAWFRGRIIGAHRLAFLLTFGYTPEPFGLHRCDNPPCCNPKHLFAGDQAMNMADMRAKGRSRGGPTGEANIQTKLTEDQVREIRTRCQNGETQRVVARDFGISHNAVGYIVRRKTWRHVL